MNVLVWNCQGIANRQTRHALKLLIQKHQISLVFLSETHCARNQHKTLSRALGLPHSVSFDRVNRAGGLALLWDESLVVNVRDVEYFYIDADINSGDDSWRFTGFYGHPETGQRHLSWDLLCSLAGPPMERWLVAGDFNELLSLTEKSGGPLRSHVHMAALTDCALEDMGAAGGSFTWQATHTKERLDRGVCTQAWSDKFSYSRVVVLAPSRSDHNPLLVEVRDEPPTNDRRRRRFRFEEIWASHASFPQVVDEAWSQPQL